MDLSGQELVGYAASILIVVSLAMSSVVRLRLVSFVGSVTFVVYGVLIGAIPIVVTNASIAVINVWYLRRELGGRRDLGAFVVAADSPFLADFLHHHGDDIRRFQPAFDENDRPDFALVLMRDGLPAGVVLGDQCDGTLDITLDYVLRAYRDSRLGRWVFGEGDAVFRSAGISTLTTIGGNDSHRAYLERVGFIHDDDTDRFTHTV